MLDFILYEANQKRQIRRPCFYKGFETITMRLIFFVAQIFVVRLILMILSSQFTNEFDRLIGKHLEISQTGSA
jgi:hypothetical protein